MRAGAIRSWSAGGVAVWRTGGRRVVETGRWRRVPALGPGALPLLWSGRAVGRGSSAWWPWRARGTRRMGAPRSLLVSVGEKTHLESFLEPFFQDLFVPIWSKFFKYFMDKQNHCLKKSKEQDLTVRNRSVKNSRNEWPNDSAASPCWTVISP